MYPWGFLSLDVMQWKYILVLLNVVKILLIYKILNAWSFGNEA